MFALNIERLNVNPVQIGILANMVSHAFATIRR
jgi:hypothetical protein